MALHDFIDCVHGTLGDVAASWDDTTAASLVELASWFQAQDATVQSIFIEVMRASGSAAQSWISAIVTDSGNGELAATMQQLDASGGIAASLSAVAECASEF